MINWFVILGVVVLCIVGILVTVIVSRAKYRDDEKYKARKDSGFKIDDGSDYFF